MGKSVLIVDDNYICVEGIHKSIHWETLGIDAVFEAYDGKTALEFIREKHADLIISDISMPGLNGLDLSEQVIRIDSSIKVILISAYDKFEYAKKAVRLGAFDYIEKPIDYDYLTEILSKALSEIEQEHKNLEILKKSRPAMEEQFFRSLIQPNLREQPETLRLYADYLDLNLDCNYCMALHISAEDSLLLKQKLGIEEYHVRFMNLENYILKICNEFPVHYLLKDLSGFICILGAQSVSRAEFKKKIIGTFSQTAEIFSDRFDLVIGLGKIVTCVWDLAASYAQAQKALEYRFFFPSQNILEATAISGCDSSLILGKDAQEDELIQFICKNDLDSIRVWISDFKNSFPGNCGSKNLVYTRLYSVIARILKFCCEMNLTNDSFEHEITAVFSNPEKFKNIDAISGWLYSICENVCGHLQASVANYHQSLCESVVSYIEKNYPDSNLNLNEIAEHVQITPTYLSTLFKKYKQQNISNFITDVRIDASCQLLKNTALSLKVISTRVGYSNQYYFSSCFKKKTGMTPSAYREQYMNAAQ